MLLLVLDALGEVVSLRVSILLDLAITFDVPFEVAPVAFLVRCG
jgi:hypothetical protein